MFGIDSSELAVVALVALLVIGPKDLPRVMRMVGQWIAKGRGMTRHLRAGFDTMMREAELEEMQKQWAAQNEAIMKATALPDLGIRNPLPGLSADEWMSPAATLTPDNIDADVPPPAADKPRRRKAAPKAAAADDAAPKPPRKRSPKAAPQPTEP
jgi:sec-independent protein translocase protein TatB